LNSTALRKDAHRVASSLSPRQQLAFAGLHAKLQGGQAVNSIFLGGSVLNGNGCSDPALPRASPPRLCAYPARFERWMQRCAGHSFHISNQATGATTTVSMLPQLPQHISPAPEPRLIVIDFSTNDAVYRTGDAGPAFTDSPLVAAQEVQLHWLLSERPADAILLLDSDCVPPSHGLYIGTREARARVAQHYKVAYLRFATGFRDGISCSRAPPVWTRSMRGHHPGYESHQHVADLLALWLPELLAAAARRRPAVTSLSVTNDAAAVTPLTSEGRRMEFEMCSMPLVTHSAADHEEAWKGVQILAGTWSLDRTRADKPGWQTDEPGSALSFEMRFGEKPRLTVVYEQSYERFGDAELTMLPRRPGERAGTRYKGKRLLSGLATSNTTQAASLVVQVGTDDWNVRPHGNATFVITTTNNPGRRRFKVRRISSC
tara:strand:+ start:105 stop:1400 length:1296 start_codon:yes stop_codon:yes gene_type:complete